MSSVCPISACASIKLSDCLSDFKKKAIQISEQFAPYILCSIASALLTYCLVPASWAVIAVPLVAIAAGAVSYYWFSQPITLKPLPPGAPRGIANSGANCWVNALFQMIHADRQVKEWLLSPACNPELRPFQNFIRAYDKAYAEGLPLVEANSQELRTCLASLMSKPGIHFEASKEGDIMEGWTLIYDRLPFDFKPFMVQTRYYTAREGQPPIPAEQATRSEILPSTPLSLAIVGENPTLATLMDAYCNVPADGSALNIGGISYQKSRETIHFFSAPASLWIDIKRFNGEGQVDMPDQYNLPLPCDATADYRLVSFAVHSGQDNRGHYVSYRRGPGDGHWYQISDSQVTVVSEEQMRAQSRKAYFVHYARMQ